MSLNIITLELDNTPRLAVGLKTSSTLQQCISSAITMPDLWQSSLFYVH